MFKHISINRYVLNCDKINDQFVMLSNYDQIANILQIIKNEDNSITLYVSKFNNVTPFYNYPLPSNIVSMFIVDTSNI